MRHAAKGAAVRAKWCVMRVVRVDPGEVAVGSVGSSAGGTADHARSGAVAYGINEMPNQTGDIQRTADAACACEGESYRG